MQKMPRTALSVVTVIAGVVAIAGNGAAVASPRQLRVGSTTPLPTNAQVTGAAPASTRLHMTVALQPQDPSGLAAFATAVSTPGKPQFRDYLTVTQFAQRFGATPAAITALQGALRAAGLQVGSVTANDLTIPVRGSAAQVEKAFSLSLSHVKLTNGQTTYANVQAPALPASIAAYVQGVVGLSNATPDQPVGRQTVTARAPRSDELEPPRARPSQASAHVDASGAAQPCSTATAASHATPAGQQIGYTADEIAAAYQFPALYAAGDLGQGQTVALFEQQPTTQRIWLPTKIAMAPACQSQTSTSTAAPAPTNPHRQGAPGTANRRSTSSK